MKILKLSAENIKRLSVVEITPDGSPVIVISGKNGAGKSSVLDAIQMAIGGAAGTPGMPVRAGEPRGKVVVDMGDIVVTRTFTATGGGSLIVANKEGARFGSPQALLDKLIGRLSFDPLEFERMKPEQQRDTMRTLVGLDTDDLDRASTTAYNERTVINRSAKQLEGQLANLHAYPDAPTEEVSIVALTAELDAAEQSRLALEKARAAYETAAREHTASVKAVAAIEEAMEALRVQLVALEAERVARLATATTRKDAVRAAEEAGLAVRATVVDSAPIRARMAESESVNRQVRANVARREALSSLEEERKAAQVLTDRLAALETEKQARLSAVTFPVPGLGLDARGVTLDGVPFDQASQAQRLRVSVAMGLALNPQLRVLLVREGSALDRSSMALLAELATAADAQVWLERVAETEDGVSVFIEEGAVKSEPVGAHA